MKNFLAAACMVLALGAMACGRDETAEPVTEATTTELPGVTQTGDLAPTTAQSYIDDVTIGSELAPDGSMVAGKTGDDFAPGQPIHIAIETGDAPPGAIVKLVWYGPNETKINEETKNVTPNQKYMTFSAANTSSWAQGDYRAEVWIGDEKVNQQQFNIT